jgi:hypothetical protein
MKGLIIKHSEGQYDDYREEIDALWIRDESFDWPSLYAEFQRLTKGVLEENRGKKKNFVPSITLTQFLLANNFIPVCDFEEQLD